MRSYHPIGASGIFILTLLLMIASLGRAQGPLTPTGTPAPTMKSLDEIYNMASQAQAAAANAKTGMDALITNVATVKTSADAAQAGWQAISTAGTAIISPGAYRVVKDLTATNQNSSGIKIYVSDVTLDLNGFTLHGPNSGTRPGIEIVQGANNVTVRNGTLSGWGDSGVVQDSDGWSNINLTTLFFENVHCVGNGLDGFALTSRCALLINCSATSNSACGFELATGSHAAHCLANCNKADGIYGIGIQLDNCVATGNGRRGYFANYSSTVTNCVAMSNAGHGFEIGNGALITNCVSDLNTSHGILLQTAATATHCVCRSNGNGNTKGAGICTTSFGNQIEDNNVSNNSGGGIITSASSNNLIVRNIAHYNSTNPSANNYVLGTTNSYGPILVNAGPAFTSTSPWANFSFQ